MSNVQFDNVQIVDAIYSPNPGLYSRPTLELRMTFDEKLSENERTKLKKLLYSQNESPDIKMAIGLQTYIPGAWARKTPKELADEAREILKQEVPWHGHSGRYPWGEYEKRIPEVDHIFYDDVATVVFWTDGTKTVVRCPEGKPYDEYAAFCAALAKKIYVNNSKLQREIKKKARYSKKRQVVKTVCGEHSVREGNEIYPYKAYKADRIIGKVTSVNETDDGLEVEVTKND